MGIVATGGVITTVGDDKVHTFNSSGTFDVTSGSGNVRYLVVAGGGAGAGSGGGAGGMRDSATATYPVVVNSYTVTVGAAVTGPANGSNTNGATGNNSVFDTITSLGGGGGAANNTNGFVGGSGSGGGRDAGATHTGGAGTAGQGNNGGGSGTMVSPFPAGGGGGAGAVGSAGADVGIAGNGGAGLASDITGVSVTYAGGGGGGVQLAGGTGGTGGTGGGGNGSASGAGSAGTANTGGGGGGCRAANAGGNGGSGVVIIRYTVIPDPVVVPDSGGNNTFWKKGHARIGQKREWRYWWEKDPCDIPEEIALSDDVEEVQAEANAVGSCITDMVMERATEETLKIMRAYYEVLQDQIIARQQTARLAADMQIIEAKRIEEKKVIRRKKIMLLLNG